MNGVLLIRPLDDALPIAKILKSKGIEPLLYPLFIPRLLSVSLPKDPQAFIITSKNALRAITHPVITSPRRGRGDPWIASSLEGARNDDFLKKVPLYVVGEQTAQLAKEMGFSTILSALGTSQELTQLILNHAHPDGGVLWHLSGELVKGNIVQELQAKGFKAERRIVYRIKEIDHVDPSLFDDIQNQRVSHVMFFSPHTTQMFINLMRKNHLEEKTSQMTALCLSQDIAEKAMILEWKEIWISPSPTTQNMVEYFNGKK